MAPRNSWRLSEINTGRLGHGNLILWEGESHTLKVQVKPQELYEGTMTKICLASFQGSPRFSIKVLILGTMEFTAFGEKSRMKKIIKIGVKWTNFYPNMMLDRTNDPSKSPRSRGEPKGKELENKDPNTIPILNAKRRSTCGEARSGERSGRHE